MSEAITLALYMLINKELGVIPKFPGNKYFYNAVDDCSYAPAIADITVWATTHGHTKNEAFNSVNGDSYVWRYLFKQIGAYFGIDVSLTCSRFSNHLGATLPLLTRWLTDP